MKNLLKSEICGSVNNAHCILFTKKKSNISTQKKKKKLKCKRASWKHKTCFPNTHYLPYLPQYVFSKPTNKSIHISSSKFSIYFTRKNLLFLFYTITFVKHPHQFIYFTRFFNKIFILLNFYYYFSQLPLPTCVRSLSLSLLIFPELDTSLSLCVSLFSTFSHSFSKTTNLDHFFTRSFLHRLIQILSSPADPRTKLHDPDPFFTGRSKNQASVTQILSSPANPRTKLR